MSDIWCSWFNCQIFLSSSLFLFVNFFKSFAFSIFFKLSYSFNTHFIALNFKKNVSTSCFSCGSITSSLIALENIFTSSSSSILLLGPIIVNITGSIHVDYKNPAATTVDQSVKNACHTNPAPNIVKHTPKNVERAACMTAGPIWVIVYSTLCSKLPLASMNSCIICAD